MYPQADITKFVKIQYMFSKYYSAVTSNLSMKLSFMIFALCENSSMWLNQEPFI